MIKYFLSKLKHGAIPFAIQYVKRTAKHRQFHVQIHTHDCYEIMFVHSGYGWCSINDRHYTLFPGDLIFMGENDTHEFMFANDCVYYNVMFNDDIIPSQDMAALKQMPFYQRFGEKNFTFSGKSIFPVHERGILESLLQKMFRETVEGGPCLELLQKAHLCELLVMIGKYSSSSRMAELTDANFSARKIANWILNHYPEKITLQLLSEKFGYSPEYLGKFFLRQAGISITKYLAYIRVEQARRLLETSNFSLSDIAYQVGFFDQAHFTKTFRNITGMQPGKFRSKLSSRH